MAFSFVSTLDGVGPWPPIQESHVEMDGAWALYEAWVKIQTGAADTALVYGYGKSSPGVLRDVLSRQLDPYYQGPLWPDSLALAALQARACLDAGVTTVRDIGNTDVVLDGIVRGIESGSLMGPRVRREELRAGLLSKHSPSRGARPCPPRGPSNTS